jgi:copper transport protein
VPRRRALLLAASLAALATPGAASAHARLLHTSPVDGSVAARSPLGVLVDFDDDIRPAPGNEVVRNGGGRVLIERPRVGGGGRTLVILFRRALADGDYSVRWSIVSDDGHPESGVLAFGVGLGRAPPHSVLVPLATGPTVDSVLARWVFLAGVLVAVGLALFALVVWFPDGEVADRLALLLCVSAVLAAVGAGDEAHRVGLATRDGTALGAGFVVALVVATLAAAATMERRALRPAVIAALCLAPVPTVAGHALDPGLARVNVAADLLHVTAAAAWVGVLVGLLAIRPPSPRRAAVLAATAVAVVAVTGIVRACYELVAVSQLWTTSYGRVLLVKTALFATALVVGYLWRTRRAAAELVVVAFIVLAVAVLVQLRPGRIP